MIAAAVEHSRDTFKFGWRHLFNDVAELHFLSTTVGCSAFILLSSLAMTFYRGGTTVDGSTEGFRFLHNFFSDLGRVSAWNGERNTVSCLMFMTCASSCGFLLLPFFLNITKLFVDSDASVMARVRLASRLGCIASLGYVGIGLTPGDVCWPLHLFFVFLAFTLSLPVMAIFAAAFLSLEGFPKRYGWMCVGFASLLACYIVVLIVCGNPHSPGILKIQVVGQKVIVYVEMLTMGCQGFGAFVYLRAKRSKPFSVTRRRALSVSLGV